LRHFRANWPRAGDTPQRFALEEKCLESALAIVIVATLAGLVCFPEVWLSSRLYPATPVAAFLRPLPSPFDLIALVAVVLALVAVLYRPMRRRALVIAVLGVVCLSFWDQSRWQTWLYQYIVMLALLSWYPFDGTQKERASGVLWACRLVVGGIYFWSGLHKMNVAFMSDVFPWMVAPFVGHASTGVQRAVLQLGIVAPATEIAIGVGLLIRRFRRAAVVAGFLMHAFILASIGPLGHDWERNVWGWNLAMIGLLWALFWVPTNAAESTGTTPPVRAPVVIALVLFWLLPTLNVFGHLDDYFSADMYSGHSMHGSISFAGTALRKLPPPLHAYVRRRGPDEYELSIMAWSFGELDLAPYPAARVFANAARVVCRATQDSSVQLEIFRRSSWFGRPDARVVLSCGELGAV
jgi:hypothetical protein